MKPVNPFKHSKTPKSRQKSTTKFKRMKQRLQYKSMSAGNGHKEQSTLQSVPHLHDVHPIAFELAPTVDCPSVEEEIPRVETNVAPKKEKVNLFNRSSPMKVGRVCKGMTREQRTLISEAEFSAILHMKCSTLLPDHNLEGCCMDLEMFFSASGQNS